MFRKIKVKSVLNKQKHVDDWFLSGYSLNPYSGCSFNCVYCYTRGSKYGEHQVPGLAVKINGPEVLVRQLKNRARKKEYAFIAMGSATDPYLPVEEEYKITQEFLRIILRFHFPVHVLTRSPLILRDLDLLHRIEEKAIIPQGLQDQVDRGVVISFSFSTLDPKLARIFEPGAPEPEVRLETMKKCKKAGFMVGAIFMPLLPYLSDDEDSLDYMIGRVKEQGADFVLAAGLTLFGEGPTDCRTLYYQALQEHFPEKVEETQALFGKSFAPSRKYQRELYLLVKNLSKNHKIRNRIY
ncbi:MAG: radical SAM protein [Methanobacteriales archaeon]|nr:radical SAM protein [Methanobacteriales archaeon]